MGPNPDSSGECLKGNASRGGNAEAASEELQVAGALLFSPGFARWFGYSLRGGTSGWSGFLMEHALVQPAGAAFHKIVGSPHRDQRSGVLLWTHITTDLGKFWYDKRIIAR